MNDADVKSEERQKLLSNLLNAIKSCQVRFGGKSELATENEKVVSELCHCLEIVLEHGLKQHPVSGNLLGKAALNGFGNVLPNNILRPSMWAHVKTGLSKHELERYMLLKYVNTDKGRGRAWIRSSLNEHSLERYIHNLISDRSSLSKSYENWAFLRDDERASMLPTMASGLSSILFAITIDKTSLNDSSNIRENTMANSESKEIIASKKSENEVTNAKVESPAEIVLNNNLTQENKSNSSSSKKKKRKKPSQIVIFDKDELRSTRPVTKPHGVLAATDQTDGIHSEAIEAEEDNFDNQISLGEEAGDAFESSLLEIRGDDSSLINTEDTNEGATTPENTSQSINYDSIHLENSCDINMHSKETTLQEKVKHGFDAVKKRSRNSSIVSALNPMEANTDEEVSDIYMVKENKKEGSDSNSNLSFESSNTETASWDGKEGNTEDENKTPPKLTPMKNSNVGALIPIGSSSLTNGLIINRDQLPIEDEIMSDDSISIKSLEEDTDYATACNSVAGSNIVSPIPHLSNKDSMYLNDANEGKGFRPVDLSTPLRLNQLNLSSGHSGFFSASASTAASSIKGGSANSRASSQIATISREEMKQALLSVMSRKDELQEQCISLKKLLDLEVEKSEALKEEIELNKRRADEVRCKQEAKINSLSRENELLKHQLKKYVSAVMKLRDGPQAYETLAKLEGDKNENNGDNKYVDYHYEASEFEKKLIQVAEMHGELLEFNEHLQKTLQAKDAIIRRLRDELVDVRGPLPDEDDDGTSGIREINELSTDRRSLMSQISTESSGIPSVRPLINIWIPSVFLSGSGSTTHHVYQVYLRIRNEEWNVYRRYSEFYAFHKDLVKKDDHKIVSKFDFPPKKTVGNKAEKIVEDRRKRLQIYLRNIVNLMVHTNPSLAARPDKEHVLDIFPFFAESFSKAAKNKTRRNPVTNQRTSIFNRRGRTVSTTEPLAL